ncbi:hypothetical protein D3C84_1091140 [compost metagenome]
MFEFEVKQAFVKNADVFRRQGGKIHRRIDPAAAAALAHLHFGTGEQAQQFVHLQIADQVLTAFQQRQCTGNAIVTARISRLE